MNKLQHIKSIKSALFLSFSVFVALTLISVLTSWHSFNTLQQNQLSVVDNSIPALINNTKLVELSSILSAQTSSLVSAQSVAELSSFWANLSASIKRMTIALISSQKQLPDNIRDQPGLLFDQLRKNLSLMQQNIKQSLLINQLIFENKIRLEWSKDDVLDELDPLLDDRQFYLQRLLNDDSITYRRDNKAVTIQLHINELVLMSSIRSQINLLSGIVTRTSDLQNSTQLNTNQRYANQLIEDLKKDSQRLDVNASNISLTQSMQDLFVFISGDNNIFQLIKTRLQLYNASLELLNKNQNLLFKFNRQIKNHAIAEEKAALQNSHQAYQKILQSQFVLLVVLIISLVIALLVGWLYVDRYLVLRICRLHRNMQLIADGNMDTEIITAGQDEISDMARSLDTFRNTLLTTQGELVQAGKLAALGQLSAGVAHELNQPLAAIRNYTHNTKILIQRNNAESAIENLNDIDQLTQRMAEIIKQFKAFSRKSSPAVSEVLLSDALDNVLHLLHPQIQQNHINLTVHSFDTSIKVQAELIRLEQVLVNIISNAIDAMQHTAHKNLHISIQQMASTKKICIDISDNGAGISGQHKDHIFEPFFTTKKPGQGLGLGLSISYNIIKDFNGTLRYRDNQPQGAVFSIELNENQ